MPSSVYNPCDYCGEEMKPNRYGYRDYFMAGTKHVHAHCYEQLWNTSTATCNKPNCEYRQQAESRIRELGVRS